mgnify:CR=1 FL=1
MKTPKRNKGNGYEADCFPFEGPNQTAFEHARWKRKNKIAQLKRTIARLSIENFELKIELGLPTHISFEEYNSRYVDFIKPDCISDF